MVISHNRPDGKEYYWQSSNIFGNAWAILYSLSSVSHFIVNQRNNAALQEIYWWWHYTPCRRYEASMMILLHSSMKPGVEDMPSIDILQFTRAAKPLENLNYFGSIVLISYFHDWMRDIEVTITPAKCHRRNSAIATFIYDEKYNCLPINDYLALVTLLTMKQMLLFGGKALIC